MKKYIIAIIILAVIILGIPTKLITKIPPETKLKKFFDSVEHGIKGFVAEYDQLPEIDNILEQLAGANKKKIKFIRRPFNCIDSFVDPWDTQFKYERKGNEYILNSAGSDKAFGTDDDMSKKIKINF